MIEYAIKILNQTHSKKVQEKLFKLGFAWIFTDKKPNHLNASYLFLHVFKDGRKILLFTNKSELDDDAIQITYNDLFLLFLPKPKQFKTTKYED